MSAFAALVTRRGDTWSLSETSLVDCASLGDLAELLRDVEGDVRLLLVEQDDEFAAIIRLEHDDDEPRAFLSDGHAVDGYPLAALVAEDLTEIGGDELADDPDVDVEVLPSHDSAPFGDAEIVSDLGTAADELIALCVHEGTLPIEVLVAVCERAGCGEAFEDLRG